LAGNCASGGEVANKVGGASAIIGRGLRGINLVGLVWVPIIRREVSAVEGIGKFDITESSWETLGAPVVVYSWSLLIMRAKTKGHKMNSILSVCPADYMHMEGVNSGEYV